ncbi:MAG: hypothetical protein RIM84_15660 [Alphaproteobacteria bacterium]
MAFALGPALFGGLCKLRIEEALAHEIAYGLGHAGAIVVVTDIGGTGKAEVGEAEGLGEHPSIAIVLVAEDSNAGVAIAGGGDGGSEVVKGGKRQHGVA